MVESGESTKESNTVNEAEAAQIRQELAQIRSEFSTICSEVQQIQQEQREMATQFQTEMQNLVGLIQMAHAASQPQNNRKAENTEESS